VPKMSREANGLIESHTKTCAMLHRVEPSLEDEILGLEKLGLAELRGVWLSKLGAPPKHTSAELLRWRLAYELQVRAYGGPRTSTIRQLERLHQALTADPNWVPLPQQKLALGVVLTKDWRGKSHGVTVLEEGFEYEGSRFQSLSEVVRAITGTKRSGRHPGERPHQAPPRRGQAGPA
jgi:Protein of unknown function (DUF2924)